MSEDSFNVVVLWVLLLFLSCAALMLVRRSSGMFGFVFAIVAWSIGFLVVANVTMQWIGQ